MNSFKEVLKGILVIILAPIVFTLIQSIGNIIGSLLEGDLTENRTGLGIFISSGVAGFAAVHFVSFKVSTNKIYYLIGSILNLILLMWSMIYQNYNWLYYSVPFVGLGFLVSPKYLIDKFSEES